MLRRLPEAPVSNDGAVFRSTQYSLLEGQEYCFQRLHLEFCVELAGSKDFVSSRFQPAYQTAPETFFKASRGNMYIILNLFSILIFPF